MTIDLWTLTGACVGYAIAPLFVIVLDAVFSGHDPDHLSTFSRTNKVSALDDWVSRRWEARR